MCYRAPGPLIDEPFDAEVMHLLVEVERRRMALTAPTFAEKDGLSAALAFRGRGRDQAALGVELRRRREVQYVLELRHMAHGNPVQDVHPLLFLPARIR